MQVLWAIIFYLTLINIKFVNIIEVSVVVQGNDKAGWKRSDRRAPREPHSADGWLRDSSGNTQENVETDAWRSAQDRRPRPRPAQCVHTPALPARADTPRSHFASSEKNIDIRVVRSLQRGGRWRWRRVQRCGAGGERCVSRGPGASRSQHAAGAGRVYSVRAALSTPPALRHGVAIGCTPSHPAPMLAH